MPFSPLHLLLIIIGVTILITLVQIGLVTVAFDKLGLSSGSALLLLLSSLIGSVINLPLFTLKAEAPKEPLNQPFFGLLRPPAIPFTGKTLITVNVGGGLVPLFFSAYLLRHNNLSSADVVAAIAIVTAVSYFISRPIRGIGIGMPILIAPVCAAIVAVSLNSEASAPLAYISGTLGVLIGADILRLNNVRRMGMAVASIGGAGTFDGIFITGIIAVLLA